jgi:hypothetical protein
VNETIIEVKLKKPHIQQQLIFNEARRFNVLKCGRRFGKTVMTEELAIQPALDGFPVGYWTPTYKDVNKVWDEIKFITQPVIKKKDEQLKQLQLITGGSIDFWSMEDPNNGRGFKYKRAIIDEGEKARHLKEIWERVIRGTLIDYAGDAWIFSTPKFGQTYFKELSHNKTLVGFEDWNSWVKTTYDNPHIPAEEIEAAKRQLDDLTFRCEFLAEDVDLVGKPFAYAFSPAKHIGKCNYNPYEILYLSFDFNVDPVTATCRQKIADVHYFIKEYRIENSDTYELCARIKSDFPNAVLLVTGDATGSSRNSVSKGNVTQYQIIQRELGLNLPQIRVPTANPAVSATRTLLNSILQNANVVFDADNCPNTIKDLRYVEVDGDGDIIKDRSTETKKADLLDCVRYDFWTFERYFLKQI